MSLAIRLTHPFRALRHRDFLLYWSGQGISVCGTWMQITAQSWMVYRLTNSPLALGVLTALKFSPSLVISPLAGLWADMFPRKRILLFTQTTSLLVAATLAFLAFSGLIRVAHIMSLALIQGCVDALDMTVRQTFQMDLTGPEDLQSAISLNSAAFNSARMIGPPIAGAIIAWQGESLCFALNAISYLAVLLSLFLVQNRPAPAPVERGSLRQQLSTGIHYVMTTPATRRVMTSVALTTVVALSTNTLTPALARDVLHTNSLGYGKLLLSMGLGAVLGAMTAAALSTSRRVDLVNMLVLCGQGASLLALSQARSLPATMLSLTFLSSMSAAQLSTSNSYLQTNSPPDLRGRVVSIYVWILHGLAPLGGFAAGWAAQYSGVQSAIFGAGAICAVTGMGFGTAFYTRSKALKK